MASCQIPSQELSNGFCYTKCQPGWTGYGSMCLQNCPPGFTDHGMACEAPSTLRTTVKSFIASCQPGQVDRNGDCFEPQTFSNGPQGPSIAGCGCIKKTLKQRIQCPTGYTYYNNGCVSVCPQGYKSILDETGAIASMYCTSDCPNQDNSKSLWTSLGQNCVKPTKKRLEHSTNSVDQYGQRQSAPNYGIPNTTLSALSKRPLGSSLNDRVRTNQSVSSAQSSQPGNNFLTETWKQLINQPIIIVSILVGFFFLKIAGPFLFAGVGKLLGSLTSATGTLVQGAADLTKAGLETTAGAINVVGSIENAAASKTNLYAAGLRAQAAELLKQANELN